MRLQFTDTATVAVHRDPWIHQLHRFSTCTTFLSIFGLWVLKALVELLAFFLSFSSFSKALSTVVIVHKYYFPVPALEAEANQARMIEVMPIINLTWQCFSADITKCGPRMSGDMPRMGSHPAIKNIQNHVMNHPYEKNSSQSLPLMLTFISL